MCHEPLEAGKLFMARSQLEKERVAEFAMQLKKLFKQAYPEERSTSGVGGMAVPLEKVSPRTFMPRHDCPPGHWCLGMNVPSRHYCPPMPDIFS